MKKKNQTIALILFILFFSLFSVGAYTMSILDTGKVCLFSGMKGVITLDGEPVANAKIIRTANRDGDKHDSAKTNNNGEFSFEPMFERTVTKFLPQEFSASQKMVVEHNDKKYEIWTGVKRTPEENAEAKGKLLDVKCELALEEMNYVKVNGGPIFSRCEWDVEPDEQFDGPLFDK